MGLEWDENEPWQRAATHRHHDTVVWRLFQQPHANNMAVTPTS